MFPSCVQSSSPSLAQPFNRQDMNWNEVRERWRRCCRCVSCGESLGVGVRAVIMLVVDVLTLDARCRCRRHKVSSSFPFLHRLWGHTTTGPTLFAPHNVSLHCFPDSLKEGLTRRTFDIVHFLRSLRAELEVLTIRFLGSKGFPLLGWTELVLFLSVHSQVTTSCDE